MEKVTLKNKSGLPRIAALVLVAVLSTLSLEAFAANPYVKDGIKYYLLDEQINGKNCAKVQENNYSGEVKIPDEVEWDNGGMAVVKYIEDNAFGSNSYITSVSVGNNVTAIDAHTFNNCTALKSVTIGNGVTAIGVYAFNGCTALETVTIGSGVETIGDYAFNGCKALNSVTLGDKVKTISDFAFQDCSSLTSIKFPSSVTTIGGAFIRAGLTEVIIPSTVTRIGNTAFNGCPNLTAVTMESNTPPTFGTQVFDNHNSNLVIYVPKGSGNGYKGANNLTRYASLIQEQSGLTYSKNDDGTLTVTGLKTGSSVTNLEIPAKDYYNGATYSVTAIGAQAFYQCSGLTSVTIPEGVTSIGASAFSGCNNESFTSITIPEGVTTIGGWAFYNCNKLTAIDIPSSVTSVGDGAFQACSALATVGGCEGLTSIAFQMFHSCDKLSAFEIGSKITSIGSSAFQGCSTLSTITIPSSVTTIGGSAFYNCSSLATITSKAESAPSVGDYAFDGCNNIATVYVPAGCGKTYKTTGGWMNFEEKIKELPITAESDGVMIYYQYTDDSKTALEVTSKDDEYSGDITIPDKVEYNGTSYSVAAIGEGAFSSCTGLTSVTIPNSVTSIGTSAFQECRGLTSISIPESVTSIGSYTFHGCEGLTSIIINEGVKSIGKAAFKGCNNAELTTIEIPSSVESIGDEAFAGCTKLATVTSNIQAPPAINSNVFYTSTLTNGTLYVPARTKSAYAAAEGWKEFKNIDDGATDDDKDDEDKDEDEDEDNPDDEDKDDNEEKPDEDTDEENPDEEEEEVVSGPDISERNSDGKIINYNYAGNMQELYVTKGDYWGVINIPETVRGLPVTGIESEAFSGSTDLTGAGIPRSVTTIGDGAFSGCSSLEAVTIRSTVETIGAGAFSGCIGLKKVVAEDIPAWCAINFGNIESNPLSRAGHLYSDEYTEITDLTIPNTVKRIGEAAFAGCIGLRSVSIGNNLKSEEYYDGVKEIANSAFYGCSNLVSVTLRGSVESIGAFAFCDCDILDSIAIPSGVKAIGDMAFYCSNITKVVSYIPEPFAIKASVFGGNTLMNGTLRVPDGTVDKYKSTEGWREFAHIVGGSSTGIEDINAGKVTIQSGGGALHISGVKDGTRITIYSMTGMVIGSGNVAGGTATIPTGLRGGDIAIVRIGDTAVKVMMQ